MGILRSMARAYHNNTQSLSSDCGRCPLPFGVIVPHLLDSGDFDPDYGKRLLVHPSYPLVVGKGIYEYPRNPDITRNFPWHVGRKVDATSQRTISSNVLVQSNQAWEDIVVTEIWLGSDDRLSVLNEMFHVFYAFWNKELAVGEFIGWCPFDVTTDRFAVRIVRLTLGDVDYDYREVREHITKTRSEAYLLGQLTLQLKIERAYPAPLATIVAEGL